MNMKKGKTIRIPLLGDMVVSLYRTLIGIALGLVASGILIAISGVNPFTAYGATKRQLLMWIWKQSMI